MNIQYSLTPQSHLHLGFHNFITELQRWREILDDTLALNQEFDPAGNVVFFKTIYEVTNPAVEFTGTNLELDLNAAGAPTIKP